MRRSSAASAIVLLMVGGLTVAMAAAMALMMAYNQPMLAVLGAIGSLLAFAICISAEANLVVYLIVGCTDGLLKGWLPGWGSIVLKDVVLALAFLRWFWYGIVGVPRGSLHHPVAFPMVVFSLYCCAQMFNSETASWLLALAGVRTWIGGLPLFFILYDTLETRRQANRLLTAALVMSVVTSVYGVIQHRIGFGHLFALSPGFSFYSKFGEGETLRAASSYVGPGAFGGAMAIIILLALGLAFSLRAGSPMQLVYLLAAGICAVGMGASGSRGPLLEVSIGVAILILLTRRVAIILGLALLVAVVAWQINLHSGALVGQRWGSARMSTEVVTSRSMSPLVAGWLSMVEYPLGTGVASGVGTGRVGAEGLMAQPIYASATAAGFVENEYGRAMKELGIPGFLLFVWLLWRACSSAYRGYKDTNGPPRALEAALVGSLVATCAGLGIGAALYPGTGAFYFWMACAVASRYPGYLEQERLEQEQAYERTPEQAADWNELAQPSGERPPPVRRVSGRAWNGRR